jgi:DNA topoisomerase-1
VHFAEILDYNFTANVEKEFDEIAEGEIQWEQMINKFYDHFHPKVEKSLEIKGKTTGERLLGTDPVSGEDILVKVGRFGPVVQLGRIREGYKPRFASLLKSQRIDTLKLEDALTLFKLPRTIGELEDKEIVAGIGKFGPYLRHDGKFYSIQGAADPLIIDFDAAVQIISDKRAADKKKVIQTFPEEPDLKIQEGRYGPYISYKKKNYKIPSKLNPAELTLEECKKIIELGDKKKAGKKK